MFSDRILCYAARVARCYSINLIVLLIFILTLAPYYVKCMPVAPFVQTAQHVETTQYAYNGTIISHPPYPYHMMWTPCDARLARRKRSCICGLYSVLLRNKAVTAAFMSASLRKVSVFPRGLYVSDAPVTVH